MFGLIVSGRMVTTNFQTVGDTQFMAEIMEAEDVNHIVIFLTGQRPLPPGTAALIYFSWPIPGSSPKWQLLGYIGNDKPSSVFKITEQKKKPEEQARYAPFEDPVRPIARIGISIEALHLVQQEIDALEPRRPDPAAQIIQSDFIQNMLDNFVNYAGSFAVTQSQMVPNPSQNYVPLYVIQTWYDNFLRKLAIKPNFWKS